jgi:hypothetical protein
LNGREKQTKGKNEMKSISGERILAAAAVSRHVPLPSGDGLQKEVTVANLGQVTAFVALSHGGSYTIGVEPMVVASETSIEVAPGRSVTLPVTSQRFPITGRCDIAAIAPEGFTVLAVAVGK